MSADHDLKLLVTVACDSKGRYSYAFLLRYNEAEKSVCGFAPPEITRREQAATRATQDALGRLKRPCRIDLRTDVFELCSAVKWGRFDGGKHNHLIRWVLVSSDSPDLRRLHAQLQCAAEHVDPIRDIFFDELGA
ncbi:hypothetical protein [Geoalkalibacter halelectricus]|uniref:hypothetical protein n=1 Tax=Geoalkalibacter halelectricus TaxID=2847045 RepID=UPI0026702D04|nr:hypothetical protein [Geoalkalibacter halelectricus]